MWKYICKVNEVFVGAPDTIDLFQKHANNKIQSAFVERIELEDGLLFKVEFVVNKDEE